MRSRKKKYHVRKKASISFGPYILESVGPATPFISLKSANIIKQFASEAQDRL